MNGRVREMKGFMIVEALLSLLFLGLLAGVLQSYAIASMRSLQLRRIADDLDETARIGIEIISRDVRDSGYGMAAGGVLTAHPSRIALARDLDLDGELHSPNERVAYALHAEERQLRRQLGGAAPQPMIENIDPESPIFEFRDEQGVEISRGLGLDPTERSNVRRIDIVLNLSAPHPIEPGERISVTHRAVVSLRNVERR